MAFNVIKPQGGGKTPLLQKLYSALLNDAGADTWNSNLINQIYPNPRVDEINEILSKKKMPKGVSRQSLTDELAGITAKHNDALDAIAANPLKTKLDLGDGTTVNALANTGNLMGNWIANHPFKTAGIGATGLMNLGGLFDDSKIVGQLAGLGGGLAASKFLMPKITGAPFGMANTALLTLGGGALGSLFDKLMAKKEAEQAQYVGQY